MKRGRKKKLKKNIIDDDALTQCEKCGKEITEFEADIRNDKEWCIDCINEDLDDTLKEIEDD